VFAECSCGRTQRLRVEIEAGLAAPPRMLFW
jgi:hypothetical protein